MRLDGSEPIVIAECFGPIDWLTVYNGFIYYINGSTLYKVSIIDQVQEKVAELGGVVFHTINRRQSIFYYSTLEGSFFGVKMTLHLFDLDTESLKSTAIPFLNKHNRELQIYDYTVGDKIVRYENGKFFIMDFDGNSTALDP